MEYPYLCVLLLDSDRCILLDIVVAFCPFEICRDAVDKGVIGTGTGIFFDEMNPVAMSCQNIGHR